MPHESIADLIQAFTAQHPLLAEHFPYLLVFTLLYLSGLGLPLPEEASLVLGGYLIYLKTDDVEGASMAWPLAWMISTACVAILGGDLTVYWLGRRYGKAFLSHRWMRWVFSKQNLGRIDRFYDRFGLWTVFVSRFVAGIRVGSFFLAGASRVRPRTFLLMDGMGALISVPLSVWLAFHFGEEINLTLKWLGAIFRNLALLVALAACAMLWWQIRRARREGAAGTADPSPPPGTSS